MSNEKVTVFCAARTGLRLQLYKVHGDAIPDPVKSTPVVLHHGANPNIDRDFVEAWIDENKGGDLVKLVTIAEQVPVEGGEPGVDHVTERPDKEASITGPAPDPDKPADDKPADA